MSKENLIQLAQDVLRIEADSILNLSSRIDDEFLKACDAILNCRGKLIITGIGKSGHIGKKIASTFTSTGTPAIFLHPAESSHGDLGIIGNEDVVLALSYGGETSELHSILNYVGRRGIFLIALTGKKESSLAQAANIWIDVKVEKEACPLNLAPTSSSTAMLAMGDTLAMVVLHQRDFKTENFAEFHPAGSLGAKLLRVKDVMKSTSALPFVSEETSMKEVLTKMTHETVRGAAVVLDPSQCLIGVITDGDIRRYLERNLDPMNSVAKNLMSLNPKTIDCHEYAEKALFMMEQFRIQMLVVLDQKSDQPRKPVGMLIYQDLLSAKVR